MLVQSFKNYYNNKIKIKLNFNNFNFFTLNFLTILLIKTLITYYKIDFIIMVLEHRTKMLMSGTFGSCNYWLLCNQCILYSSHYHKLMYQLQCDLRNELLLHSKLSPNNIRDQRCSSSSIQLCFRYRIAHR